MCMSVFCVDVLLYLVMMYSSSSSLFSSSFFSFPPLRRSATSTCETGGVIPHCGKLGSASADSTELAKAGNEPKAHMGSDYRGRSATRQAGWQVGPHRHCNGPKRVYVWWPCRGHVACRSFRRNVASYHELNGCVVEPLLKAGELQDSSSFIFVGR